MTSQNMEAKEIQYKCPICKDSGWIFNNDLGTYSKCQCVDLDYLKRLWQGFGIKPSEVKKLNEYVPFDDVTKIAKSKAVEYIKNFDSVKSNRENSYGLFGQPGAGKSHIVIAVGAALLNRKDNPIPVVYMPYFESMRELKANTMDDEYYNSLLNRYSRAKLLIIDDLFKDKMRNGELIKGASITEADMKHIYPILNYRYANYLPTVFSTECTPLILNELDEALAGRILETCGDNMAIFQDKKYNYRMRKFMKV
jgi:DNA replication protein DnaC